MMVVPFPVRRDTCAVPWWGWLLVGIWLTLGLVGAQGFSDETGTGWEDWYDALSLRGEPVVVDGEIVSGAGRRRALAWLQVTLLRLLFWTVVVIVLSPPLIFFFGLLSGVLFAVSLVRPGR
jgi:hypothetical protein